MNVLYYRDSGGGNAVVFAEHTYDSKIRQTEIAGEKSRIFYLLIHHLTWGLSPDDNIGPLPEWKTEASLSHTSQQSPDLPCTILWPQITVPAWPFACYPTIPAHSRTGNYKYLTPNPTPHKHKKNTRKTMEKTHKKSTNFNEWKNVTGDLNISKSLGNF